MTSARSRLSGRKAAAALGWRPYLEELEPRMAPALLTPVQMEDALPMVLNDGVSTVQVGTIELPYERDLYQLTIPQTEAASSSRSLHITQRTSDGSSLDSQLTIYNAAGMLLSSNDDAQESLPGANPLDSELEVLVVSGRTYFVQAAGVYVSTGDYELQLDLGPAPDDFPNTLDQAHTLALEGTMLRSVLGKIDPDGDVDVFRFVTAQAGRLDVAVNTIPPPGSAAGLRSQLAVLDASGALVAGAIDSGNQSSFVQLDATQGQEYFVMVGAAEDAEADRASGEYSLIVSAGKVPDDDFGDTLNSAATLVMDEAGRGSQFGTIDQPGEVDVFSFQAPFTGQLEIALNAFPASTLDGELTVLDTTRNGPVSYVGSTEGSHDSLVRFRMHRGHIYYVRAGGVETSFGDYILSVAPSTVRDDFGDTFETAYTLNYPSSGSARLWGRIDVAGDQDMIAFLAPTTGSLTVALQPQGQESLDGTLAAFDSQGKVLASGSQLQIDMIQDERYFIQVCSNADAQGDYLLDFRSDGDPPEDDFSTPGRIELSRTGTGVQSGFIEVSGDTDAFRFTAPLTGMLTLTRTPAPGSELESSVRVSKIVDDKAKLMDILLSRRTSLQFEVQKNAEYLLQLGAISQTTGGYDLTLRIEPEAEAPKVALDDFGNDFATAYPLRCPPNGIAHLSGTFEATDDVDMISVRAPATGTFTVTLHSPGTLTVYDGNRRWVGEGDEVAGLGAASQIQLQAIQGKQYFIRCANAGSQSDPVSGDYSLDFHSDVPWDVEDDFPVVAPLALSATGAGSRSGTLESLGDTDLFELVASRTGILDVSHRAALGSSLQSSVRVVEVTDQGTRAIAAVGTDAGKLSIPVLAGSHYLLEVSAAADETAFAIGGYDLTIRTDPMAEMPPLTANGAGQASDVIETVGDVDWYHLTTTAEGMLLIAQTAAAGSTLDSRLTIFDSAGQELRTSESHEGQPDALVALHVEKDKDYFLQAEGQASFGGYDLTVRTVPSSMVVTELGQTTGTGELTPVGPGQDVVGRRLGGPGDYG